MKVLRNIFFSIILISIMFVPISAQAFLSPIGGNGPITCLDVVGVGCPATYVPEEQLIFSQNNTASRIALGKPEIDSIGNTYIFGYNTPNLRKINTDGSYKDFIIRRPRTIQTVQIRRIFVRQDKVYVIYIYDQFPYLTLLDQVTGDLDHERVIAAVILRDNEIIMSEDASTVYYLNTSLGDSQAQLKKFDMVTKVTTIVPINVSIGDSMESLALDKKGNIYFVTSYENSTQKHLVMIKPSGAASKILISDPTGKHITFINNILVVESAIKVKIYLSVQNFSLDLNPAPSQILALDTYPTLTSPQVFYEAPMPSNDRPNILQLGTDNAGTIHVLQVDNTSGQGQLLEFSQTKTLIRNYNFSLMRSNVHVGYFAVLPNGEYLINFDNFYESTQGSNIVYTYKISFTISKGNFQ
jgi:hypothetical protein